MDQRTRQALLALYDVPDADEPGRVIPGYDRDHAERTTRIVMRMARALGLDPSRYHDLEVTALLHDLGRAGMDPQLFGQLFGLAQELGLPVRIKELRGRYPQVAEEEATQFFLDLLGSALKERGIASDERLIDHARMRMDFKRRLRRVLAEKETDLKKLGVTLEPWMEKVMLYYYYPQEMTGQPQDVRLMAMILVACENFEAYNNWRRGRDYYARAKERLREVFAALERFREDGLVSPEVMAALRSLTASGQLDAVIKESRGVPADEPLPQEDLAFLKELASGPA